MLMIYFLEINKTFTLNWDTPMVCLLQENLNQE